MESTFDLQADQVSTNVFLAVCKWMKNGEENTADWIRLLNELNKIDDLEKRTALTGIILNILLENGNEIAVATTINTLPDEFLQERIILFAKARLLGRNRNSEDARQTYQKALNMPMKSKQSNDPDESILTTLVNLPKWQADCAFERGDWENAVVASIQCLQFPAYYSYMKENTINRIYNLALKEWSYQKIGVSKNLPAVIQKDEFTNLSQQYSSVTAELQNQYTFLHTFLLNGQIQSFESASEEPLSLICQMINASNQKQYEKMLQIIEKGKKVNDLPLIALGLFPEDKFNELIPAFQDAFHENKKDPYLSAGMAKIFMAENETDLAIDAYENALNILTDEPLWRTDLAKLYEEKGELQKAILHSEQAVTLDPGNQNNKKEYLEDLYAIQDYRKVIEVFEENQQQFNNNDAILRMVINAYFQVGEYRKALSYIQMQQEKMKDDLEMLLIQARIAEKLGSIPKAMEIIRSAYQIDPKSPEVIIELARIKSLEENDGFGLEIIEKALESNI
ncbi:MAG: tetratricopeptide repeat protein, partial [SAR324 cluster bacterium]|nr:tetratricopeptide repeat protein [SAR324 cluster bacterium]